MRAGNGRGKVRLLTRQSLDGRTKARKQFDAIAEGIAADLGGEDRLSTVQHHLVEAFAGCAIVLQAINARILLGEPVDISDQSSAASTLVRIASRIGIDRVPRLVQSPDEYIAGLPVEEPADLEDSS
jgi:hypothetical protein